MSTANDRQIGGDHYRKHGRTGEQHWDRIVRLYPDSYHVYFVAAVTKYVERYRDKNGVQDLEKALHYLEKLIEVEKDRAAASDPELQSAVFDRVRERADERAGGCDHDWDVFGSARTGEVYLACVKCFTWKPAGEGVSGDAS